MLLSMGAVLIAFLALCGIFLLGMLLFSNENDDMHFGRPRHKPCGSSDSCQR